jgi:hypothetical protein
MSEMRSTDISNLPEVRRLAEEVKETRRPRVLKAGNEEIAVLKPASTARGRKAKIRTK